MRIAPTHSRGRLPAAVAAFLVVLPALAQAQLFGNDPIVRPPADIPDGVPPVPQNLNPAPAPPPPPPGGGAGVPRGPMLQAVPPTAPARPATPQITPAVPAGQVQLSLSARYGRDLPEINGGLHWRIYPGQPEVTGGFRLIREERTAAPVFNLPPGSYVVFVGFGLASATKAVQVRAEPVREVLEIPAGGLRIEGKVGDVRIPHGQISFELYRGSQFEPGDKRPVVAAVQTGDVILIPEGTYHIVSNYGDANSTVRHDIR